jgi:MATE family multidrug resistance protein
MNDQVTVTDTATATPQTNIHTWGGELRATFALAWPLVIAQLAQNLLHTTDVILLGWLGANALAAGTLAGAFVLLFQVAGIGVIGAVAPLVAQARGARDIKAVRRIVRQGCWAAFALCVVLIPIIWQVRPIFKLLGQNPETTELAAQFVEIAAFSLIPAFVLTAFRSLLSAFSLTRAILIVTVLGVTLNAVLAYGLIFGNFGLPRLELRGAALATLIANCFMCLALMAYVLLHRRLKRFHVLVRFWKPDWKHFREIFRLGTPIGLTVLAEVSLFSAAAFLMGWLGTDEVAGHAITMQLTSLAFMVPLGLGVAATVRVGISYGSNNPDGIRKAGWTAFGLGTGFMAISCTIFLTLGAVIVTLFLNKDDPANANALHLAASYLVIAGLFQIIDGAQVVAAHALRGLSDTKIPMFIAIFGYWCVGLPTAYFLGFVANWRGVGIWTGLAAGLAFVAVILVARFAMRERLGLLRAR